MQLTRPLGLSLRTIYTSHREKLHDTHSVPVYLCMPTHERRHNMDNHAGNATIARCGLKSHPASLRDGRRPARFLAFTASWRNSFGIVFMRAERVSFPNKRRKHLWNSNDAPVPVLWIRSRIILVRNNIFGGAPVKRRSGAESCSTLRWPRPFSYERGKKKGAHSLRDILRSSRILLHRYFLIAPG